MDAAGPCRSSEELARIGVDRGDIKVVFHAPTTTIPERKQPRRAVITEIVVNASDRITQLRIIWQGGAAKEVTMKMNTAGGRLSGVTSENTLGLVRRPAACYDDRTIVAGGRALQHRRTVTGLSSTRARVSKATVYRWLREGFITGGQFTRLALADPHRPDPARAHPARRPRRLAAPRPGPPRSSGSPARPCCTRSGAANSPRSTSTAGAAKACATGETPPACTAGHTLIKEGEVLVMTGRSDQHDVAALVGSRRA